MKRRDGHGLGGPDALVVVIIVISIMYLLKYILHELKHVLSRVSNCTVEALVHDMGQVECRKGTSKLGNHAFVDVTINKLIAPLLVALDIEKNEISMQR